MTDNTPPNVQQRLAALEAQAQAVNAALLQFRGAVDAVGEALAGMAKLNVNQNAQLAMIRAILIPLVDAETAEKLRQLPPPPSMN